MSCFHPLIAYRTEGATSGPLHFRRLSHNDVMFTLPCGGCDGCRLERSRQWAVRCMHEASLHEHNSFITLTYDDEHLPASGSLIPKDFQDFMKRLRKSISPQKVRFFHAGEYGERFGRPHYHALLFGYDFSSDRRQWTMRRGMPVWRSGALERLWSFGQSEIGTVTFESAAYVARYILKKSSVCSDYVSVNLETGELIEREREYCTMSRGGRARTGGIGKSWFDRFSGEVYSTDSVVVRGRECKPPRFYDKLLKVADPGAFELVCSKRSRERRREDETPERRAVLETVHRARMSTFKRELG